MDDIKKTDELNDSQLESANGGLAPDMLPNSPNCPDCGVQLVYTPDHYFMCPKCKKKFGLICR